MGQHKSRVEASHGRMTPKQIRAAKCERSRLRNLQRRKEAREQAEERQDTWAKLTPKEQLEALDCRFGKDIGAKKQRKRILKKICVLARESENGITD